MALSGRYSRSRRRREQAAIAAVLFLAIASPVLLPRLLGWLKGSVPGGGTAGTVSEALAIAEALGDHPNDDQLIKAIQDRGFAGRLLAIELLGEGGYGDALPVLDAIVRDSSEADRFRVAALEAVYRIAAHQGHALAFELEEDPVLGAAAKDILSGGESIRSRSSRIDPLVRYVP